MGLDRARTYCSQIVEITFCLLFTFPALPNALQSIVFALFLLSLTLNNLISKEVIFIDKTRLINILLLCGYYVLYLISFLYNTKSSFQSSLVQSSILLVIVPFTLSIFNFTISNKVRRIAVWVFTVSCLYLMVLLTDYWVEGVKLSHLYFKGKIDFGNFEDKHILQYIYTTSSEFITSVSQWGYFQNKQLIELNTHHTYISAVFVLNIIFILSSIRRTDNVFLIILRIIGVICFSFFIFYLDSKINVFFLSMFYAGLLINVMRQKKQKIFILLMFSITSTSVYYYPLLVGKIKSAMTEESVRFKLYEKTIPLVRDNFYTGIGANNVSSAVELWMSKDPSTFSYNFNSYETLKTTHSQYLHYQLSGGVFLLISFLAMGIFLLYKLRGSILALSAIFIVFLNCIFEDYLTRSWGVYTFMLVLIYYWSYPENYKRRHG